MVVCVLFELNKYKELLQNSAGSNVRRKITFTFNNNNNNNNNINNNKAEPEVKTNFDRVESRLEREATLRQTQSMILVAPRLGRVN